MTNQFDQYDPRPGLPLVFDHEAGERVWEQYSQHFLRIENQKDISRHKKLIHAIGGTSPYLSRLISRYPDLTKTLCETDMQNSTQQACQLAMTALQCDDEDAQLRCAHQKKILRNAKDHAALAIGLNDARQATTIMASTEFLSDFADVAVDTALKIGFRHAATLGFVTDDPSCRGVVILAMGKHGARELNYSSDIDLIALYDPDILAVMPGKNAQKAAIVIIQHMIDLLSDQTGDGYVFRTDLRLRPDPGTSAIAVSVGAAEAYYEAYGQNWERAAFIKARSVAGDVDLGDLFLSRLRPFIWRKYLDFAAIEDIANVRQKIITAQKNHNIVFEGFDVKLGMGGIREIEFLVQTHQLVSGGKNSDLRCRETLQGLKSLSDNGILSIKDATRLGEAYISLRFIEHRIQMVYDEQTHIIPKSEEELARLAAFCGFESVDGLRQKISAVRQKAISGQQSSFPVDQHESAIAPDDRTTDIGARENRNSPAFDFSGVDHKIETITALRTLGFARPEEISNLIRRWYRGEYRATRSERARLLLDQFLPKLIQALAGASDQDEAFLSFDRFLSRLPAGVQIFSLFVNNPGVFNTLGTILTVSPALGKAMVRHHGFLEALIEGGWIEPQNSDGLLPALHAALEDSHEHQLEDVMNVTRRIVGEARFLNAVRLVTEQGSANEVSKIFSTIAQEAITVLEPAADKAIRGQFGAIDGEMCVIGFGRLGARRMTFTSDIDVVFVYDTPEHAVSQGPRSIDGVTWFTRKVRRLVTGLSAATEEGHLYEVDMQLRPSGGAGPAAVKFTAFQKYYQHDAWVWELMALTKARIIYGPDRLRTKLQSFIDTTLRQKRDAKNIAVAIDEMRMRLLAEKPAKNIWDRKAVHGGLTDIEFILQYLILVSANKESLPPQDIEGMCSFFYNNGLLNQQDAKILQDAFILNEKIIQLSRLGDGNIFIPDRDGKALLSKLITCCDAKGEQDATQKLEKSQRQVMDIYRRTIQ